MFVDASAMIAILTGEPEGESFAAALDRARPLRPITSVVAVWEAVAGLYRKRRIPAAEAETQVRQFLQQAHIEVVALGLDDLTLALQAFDRYGRHRYPEGERNRSLNLADCFHYACAKSRNLPVLHKDQGFMFTDLVSATDNM